MATEQFTNGEAGEKASPDSSFSSKVSPNKVLVKPDVNPDVNPVLTGHEQTVLTSWDSTDDPDNPRNWTFRARLYGVFVPAWYAFAT